MQILSGKRHKATFWGAGNVLYFDLSGGDMGEYKCWNLFDICLISVHFTVCHSSQKGRNCMIISLYFRNSLSEAAWETDWRTPRGSHSDTGKRHSRKRVVKALTGLEAARHKEDFGEMGLTRVYDWLLRGKEKSERTLISLKELANTRRERAALQRWVLNMESSRCLRITQPSKSNNYIH